MPYMEYNVYLDTSLKYRLAQIIEAGLVQLEIPFDENTFEVDCTGNES